MQKARDQIDSRIKSNMRAVNVLFEKDREREGNKTTEKNRHDAKFT